MWSEEENGEEKIRIISARTADPRERSLRVLSLIASEGNWNVSPECRIPKLTTRMPRR
jgi:hypothetical protein